MKNLLIAIGATALIAGCTATQQGAAVGSITGAAIGGAVTGDVKGALVGGAVGGVTGALIGKANEPGECLYRDQYGRQYIARCP